ncbi:DUF6194 family protein [Kribbella endophytica]
MNFDQYLDRPGVRTLTANGDTFWIYDPAADLPPERQMPWATLVTSDVYDSASNLDRPGVERLNLGLPKADYLELFPSVPDDVDYTALDVVLPHPVYAPQYWICVVSPSEATLKELEPLTELAYRFAVRKYDNFRRR